MATDPLNDAARDAWIRAIYGEAGGEPFLGQIALANVIKNRVLNGNYGRGVPGVVFTPNQFIGATSANAKNLDRNSPEYKRLGELVDAVADNVVPDVTNGALNFYNPAAANPSWAQGIKNPVRIGNHLFGSATNAPAAVQRLDTVSNQAGDTQLDAPVAPNVDIGHLNQRFADKMQDLLQDAQEDYGVSSKIISGYRDQELQRKLWENYLAAQRRQPLPYPQEGSGGKAAPPGQSHHNFGTAADIQSSDLNRLIAMAPNYGLMSGASFRDPGHFQLPGSVGAPGEAAQPAGATPQGQQAPAGGATGFLSMIGDALSNMRMGSGTPTLQSSAGDQPAIRSPALEADFSGSRLNPLSSSRVANLLIGDSNAPGMSGFLTAEGMPAPVSGVAEAPNQALPQRYTRLA